MNSIDCTLVSDGSSDSMLIPAIRWLLIEHNPDIAFNFETITIRQGKKTLAQKICIALDYFHVIFYLFKEIQRKKIMRVG